jgi:uncharacterized membrane protein
MSATEIGLVISVFLACAVEAVEALTIVLAMGYTRSWSASLSGAGAATVVLAAAVGLLGTAVTQVPIGALRVVVGVLLLYFGLTWLRKAVLRASGRKALHDERAIFEEESAGALAAARAAGPAGLDGYSFLISFKGVMIEGLEVVLIVIGLGANQHHLGLASAAAAAAVVAVIAAGYAVRAPLSRVPENTMKFAVGVMISSFGIFWLGEGAGISWPGGDAALLVIAPLVLGASLGVVMSLRRPALG